MFHGYGHTRRRRRVCATPKLDATFIGATQFLLGILDERQRRFFAGLESLRPESGGDQRVAAQLGMARAMVTKGRKQLLSGDFEKTRVRKPGRGRKAIEKKKFYHKQNHDHIGNKECLIRGQVVFRQPLASQTHDRPV